MSKSGFRQLAGDTVIYGLSSVLGRVIGFLLLPVYTAVFGSEDFAIQTLVYAYAAVLFVFCVMRLDVTFFRFVNVTEHREQTFRTAFTAVATLAIVITSMLLFGAEWWATDVFHIGSEYTYIIRLLAGILFFDALAEIPYAELRQQNRALKFAAIRMTNIILNVGLNLILLLFIPWCIDHGHLSGYLSWYDQSLGVGYIFVANMVASTVTFFAFISSHSKAVIRR